MTNKREFAADSYTAEGISNGLLGILGDLKMPVGAVLHIIKLLENPKAELECSDQLRELALKTAGVLHAMFLDGGATDAEIKAGAVHATDVVVAWNEAQEAKDDDSKTIH